MTDYKRYAIYYAPPAQSDLGLVGNGWLARDPASVDALPRPDTIGLTKDEITAATSSPARYGFHGTLKPPFSLRDGKTRSKLESAVAELSTQTAPVSCGPLMLKSIGRFLALVPTDPLRPLETLAASLVRELDGFRRPEDETAMNKRRAVGLTARQEENLMAWGYPYVMEEFRFHLTLTNKLDEDQLARFEKALAPIVAPVCRQSFVINDICLFGDPGGGKPFRILQRFELEG
ncbi:DUF1045 domain-containing protein [Thalassospira australica]|uniref:DUF1045 domain-containing protein n=1 Tax=Thalassospira australica TaxID=1528106 RepID=UPI000519F0A5|nr:DUF1045 domain-containing protein [Thalassospira australica]